MIRTFSVLALALPCFCASAALVTNSVPVAGNSWVVNPAPGNTDFLSHNGSLKWENPDTIIRTWFKTSQAGDIRVECVPVWGRGPWKSGVHSAENPVR